MAFFTSCGRSVRLFSLSGCGQFDAQVREPSASWAIIIGRTWPARAARGTFTDACFDALIRLRENFFPRQGTRGLPLVATHGAPSRIHVHNRGCRTGQELWATIYSAKFVNKSVNCYRPTIALFRRQCAARSYRSRVQCSKRRDHSPLRLAFHNR